MSESARRLHIFYPSGNQAHVRGRTFHTRETGDLLMGVILAEAAVIGSESVPAEAAVILDPRCVVQDSDSKRIIHHPREAPRELFFPELWKWMEEHPEWPGVLEIA